ncbi:MAG: hypothetical protein JSU66_08885, partial [Deltaproteobacteria bacterium]
MVQDGYRDVAVLVGGLQAWSDAGHPVEALPVDDEAGAIGWRELRLEKPESSAPTAAPRPESVFLPRIAGQTFLEGRELPVKREMVSLFVDMVDS